MENKYYIPTIEEFHVGFEYEIKDTGTNYYRPAVLRIIDCYSSPEEGWDYPNSNYLYRKLKDGDIRVKYLNPSDIIAEGFELIPTDFRFHKIIPTLCFKGHKHNITFHTDKIYDNEKFIKRFGNLEAITIYGDAPKEFSMSDSILFDGYIKFLGDIKNISEFRRIIKMLNIK